MTRILAVVLLCTASSIGCSTFNSNTARHDCGGQPCHLASSQSAPRPVIQRASCETPIGISEVPGGLCGCEGGGCGPVCGSYCGNDCVTDCVDCILDCDGCCGCGDACGGGCYGGGACGTGDCGFGNCCCGGTGRCECCQRLRCWWQNNCCCNGAGKCACCCKVRAVCSAARNCVCDPGAAMPDSVYNFNPGPSSAQTAYPYYTTRGPRDFFLDNPPSIGPY